MKSYTLLEGIRGWARAGEEFVQLMDDYQAGPWTT